MRLNLKLPNSMKARNFVMEKQILNSSLLIVEETRDSEHGNQSPYKVNLNQSFFIRGFHSSR
jgi:hypothetical protein